MSLPFILMSLDSVETKGKSYTKSKKSQEQKGHFR